MPITSDPKTDVWSASAGIPGIDALHSYAKDPRDLSPVTLDNPTQVTKRGESTPSRAPIPAGNYWLNRQASIIPGIAYSDNESGTIEQVVGSTEKPRDPRNADVPVDRWTAASTPNMYRFERPYGQRFAKRFWTGAHSSMARVAPFGPLAYGDGRGLKRARNTQRNVPAPLEQQIIVAADQPSETNVLAQGSSLTKWW